eukprot:TRINITY_DN378_c0_g1_i1.p1 TRINITY_DN378_c0_g1~~TRINITY_DN378_c0_g1_i1.p1  ORF type:complete len:816 (-),score=133.99 TRINITY_DN378_c0_g1_i1:2374-4689(-)
MTAKSSRTNSRPTSSKPNDSGDGESCFSCQKSIHSSKQVRYALGNKYHPECFTCPQCGKPIEGKFALTAPTVDKPPQCMHPECMARLKGDVCDACDGPIVGEDIVLVFGKKWHPDCLVCCKCGGVVEGDIVLTKGNPAHKKCPPEPRIAPPPPGFTRDPVSKQLVRDNDCIAQAAAAVSTASQQQMTKMQPGKDGASAARRASVAPGPVEAADLEGECRSIVEVIKERAATHPSSLLANLLSRMNRLVYLVQRFAREHTNLQTSAANERTALVEKNDERHSKTVQSVWNARANAAALQREMLVLREDIAAKERGNHGPIGPVALIFTDVQGSTRIWEVLNEAMRVALDTHHALFRRLIMKYGGFEVKTEGDAFMVAFSDPVAAVRFCVESQEALMASEWPPQILEDVDGCEESVALSGSSSSPRSPAAGEPFREPTGQIVPSGTAGAITCWKGLRVRMGGEFGEPMAQQDPVSGRTDYYGPAVNLAARVCGSAVGGQVLLGPALSAAAREDAWCARSALFAPGGSLALKGIAAKVDVTQCFPRSIGPARMAYLSTKHQMAAAPRAQGTLGAAGQDGGPMSDKTDAPRGGAKVNIDQILDRQRKLADGIRMFETKLVASLETQRVMQARIAELEEENAQLHTQLSARSPSFHRGHPPSREFASFEMSKEEWARTVPGPEGGPRSGLSPATIGPSGRPGTTGRASTMSGGTSPGGMARKESFASPSNVALTTKVPPLSGRMYPASGDQGSARNRAQSTSGPNPKSPASLPVLV